MDPAQVTEPAPRRKLRLSPGVALAAAIALGHFVLPLSLPDLTIFGVLGGLVGLAAVVLWWLFFSRAAWPERLGAVALMAAALYATSRLLDRSIATGAMGMLFPILAAPT